MRRCAVPELIPLVDDGLGNTTWMVGLGDGRALVVDASRDLRGVRAAAQKRGWAVSFAADTHLHADFVTGAVDLAAAGAGCSPRLRGSGPTAIAACATGTRSTSAGS